MALGEEHLSETWLGFPNEDNSVTLNERRRIAIGVLDNATFSRFHVKICLVTGAGFFTDAYDIFAISIAAIMLGYVYGHDQSHGLNALTNWQVAGLTLASSVGNLIGQLLFGWLADILGRKRMYGIELIIMIVATFGQAVSGQGPGINVVSTIIVWRIILGIGIGGDYPLSAVISSEFASTRTRGRMMTAVFASQGVGQLVAALVALALVAAFKDSLPGTSVDNVDFIWRILIGLGCIPAMIALYFRLTVPETPRFTMDIERHIGRAARDIRSTLEARMYNVYVDDDSFYEPRVAAPRASWRDFVTYFSESQNWKVLFGMAYSWFALDIAFYILALRSPAILDFTSYGSVDGDAYQSLYNLCIGNVILTVGGYIPGFIASFLLIDIWGRKPIQLMGFIILTILFFSISFNYNRLLNRNFDSSDHGTALMALYCIANFFQNFGPNTTTFIIPGELFPTRYRCTTYGISAASGKLGAVIAQILFAIYENQNQMETVFKVLSFFMLSGVFSTLLVPETKQLTLEKLSNENQETYIMEPMG